MKIHRNLHVVALVAAMMALGTQAAPVSSEQVLGAVSAWAAANGAAFAGPGSAVAARPVCDDDGTNVLYWVVTMSNGGAVIASPDTDLDLVVAVLEKYDGALPEGHPLPSILKRDLRNRLAVLAQRTSASRRPRLMAAAGAGAAEAASGDTVLAEAVSAANAQWAKYGVGARRLLLKGEAMTDDSPYVRRIVDGFESDGRFTHWNQSGGIYNSCTPNNEVCGCVATAGAAILQFFNCTNDLGEVKSSIGCRLYGQSYDCVTLAGETDWSSLPSGYGGTAEGALDEAGRQLLGRATYNMGVLVGMSWATDGRGTESGSYVENLAKAFKQYGFKTSRYVAYSNASDSDGKEFFKTLYAQLWCGAPAVLGIQRPGAGHAVVACGYARDTDGDEFCRIFMGWGGSGDSWYKLPAISDYNQVQGALTMIGYEDDAVVPVYGETNIPGAELTLPGYVTDEGPVKVPVNEYGYFGIRVPVGISDKTITYEPRGKSADIMPFDAAVIADESASRADLDAALPNELYFPIMNMTVKQTMASARAVAARDGKALLMVGGTLSTAETKLLTEYLIQLDDISDLSNRFVYAVLSKNSSDWNEPDGDPVIGVFDPDSVIVGERWQESNGRLDYENFIDYDASGETNVVVHTFSTNDVTALQTRVDELLANGYVAYLQRHSGIQVTVQGVNVAVADWDEVGAVEPAYGVITDTWTNGEVAVFSAPGTYTNEAAGVIYSCVGWTTNAVETLDGLAYEAGAEARIPLVSGMTNTLTWVWDASHYRVTASSTLPYTIAGAGQAVTPSNAWVAAGTRATITAEATIGAYHFSAWEVKGLIDYEQSGSAMLYENGTAVSFFVDEPVTVKATYRSGASGAPVSTTNTLTVVSSPAALAAEAPVPVETGFAWGENTTLDGVFSFQEATYTDATGGVWACTNVMFRGSSYGPGANAFSGKVTVTCVWTLQTQEDPPTPPGPDDPDPPTPKDITITGIEQASDGSWTITVSGAMKDCWYWLYATDDLSAVAGSADAWTADLATTSESNPQQATADGDIVFHATSSETKCFWRAKATATEEGD